MYKDGVGVVVGRFQVHKLHEGHIAILDAARRHKKMLVFIGVHPFLVTPSNPLDFPTRERMIRERYPEAMVVAVPDQRSDTVWSQNLDSMIRSYCPLDSVTLYCGRDSFKSHYHGKFPIKEIDEVALKSGTDIRRELGQEVKNSEDFRAGVVYGAYNKWPVIAPVVDILLENKNCILLGRKPAEPGIWRLPGGFVDPDDISVEDAAKRELQEETGLIPTELRCVGSYFVDDWRCTEKYKLLTILYVGTGYGAPQAGDDLAEAKWVPIVDICNYTLTKTHKMMLDKHLP